MRFMLIFLDKMKYVVLVIFLSAQHSLFSDDFFNSITNLNAYGTCAATNCVSENDTCFRIQTDTFNQTFSQEQVNKKVSNSEWSDIKWDIVLEKNC